jgi:hypothetical protein
VERPRHVSHLIVFSLEVKPSGALGALDRIPRKALMAEAQAAATKHDTALLICFGGNGRSDGFSPMVMKVVRRFHWRFMCAKASAFGLGTNIGGERLRPRTVPEGAGGPDGQVQL